MRFTLLGQDLHETAENARRFFAENYAASGFKCEESVAADLPLKPTWQARIKNGYCLCVNVQPSPFSSTLYEFVMKVVQLGIPMKFWVAVPAGSAKETFSGDLKRARETGIGVVEFGVDGSVHEYQRPVPLSLFALKKTKLTNVPRERREEVKNAEATFLEGTPGQACQAICQELEWITRQVAEATFGKGWWKQPQGVRPPTPRFFQTDSWANMLEAMEARADYRLLKTRLPKFSKQLVVKARAFTEWRNDVSHKPRTLAELKARDDKLRTMFEATRDLLLDWYDAAKPLKLLK